jgi:hypothetical protein
MTRSANWRRRPLNVRSAGAAADTMARGLDCHEPMADLITLPMNEPSRSTKCFRSSCVACSLATTITVPVFDCSGKEATVSLDAFKSWWHRVHGVERASRQRDPLVRVAAVGVGEALGMQPSHSVHEHLSEAAPRGRRPGRRGAKLPRFRQGQVSFPAGARGKAARRPQG